MVAVGARIVAPAYPLAHGDGPCGVIAARMPARLSGLPIRLRLTLTVATAMAVAFGALGIFIHEQFRRDVITTLDEGLRSRLRDVATLAADPRRPTLEG